MVSIDLYAKAVDLAEEEKPFVLASVIAARGSTPQKAGANAVFEPTGEIAGTLGGDVWRRSPGDGHCRRWMLGGQRCLT